MKLLTNKQFQRVLEKELEPLKQENDKLRDIINKNEYRYLDQYDKLKNQNEEYKGIIATEEEYIAKLNEKIGKLNGTKGGLTKAVHKLEKELAKLKGELDEANKKLSQRYIVKELKPDKAKNTQVAKIKSGSKTSKIIKKVINDE